jgi:hypothetical protein
MAAGDTILGVIRVVKETGIGHRNVVAGGYPTGKLDHFTDEENGIYINLPKGESLPLGMQKRSAPKAHWTAGEKLHLQHKSGSLAEAATVTLSEIAINIIKKDLNTGDVIEETLTVADTDLSGDVTSSVSAYVEFFTYTVPDRTMIAMAGSFNATLLEKA